MCNTTQKKKAAGAGKDFTLFLGVMLHFNFKCAYILTFRLNPTPRLVAVIISAWATYSLPAFL